MNSYEMNAFDANGDQVAPAAAIKAVYEGRATAAEYLLTINEKQSDPPNETRSHLQKADGREKGNL